ncbi:helix-turn-helix domain-containing protein, partial [Mycolicibacterium elephantis]
MTADAERKRPGRPRGTSDTRERILKCARDLFARNGVDKTSIRAVAAAAGVDPALVHHYYGTKQQLFAAAIEAPVNPMDVIRPLRETPIEELGHKLPSVLVPLWDS